jgi:hypothetical protein
VRYKKVEDVLGLDEKQMLVYFSDCLLGVEEAGAIDTLVCRYMIDYNDRGKIMSKKLSDYIDSVETANGYYQGLCPDGWHLPQREEWDELFDYVNESCGEMCRIDDRMEKNLIRVGFGDMAEETHPSLTKLDDGGYALEGLNFTNWILVEGLFFQDFSIRCVKN